MSQGACCCSRRCAGGGRATRGGSAGTLMAGCRKSATRGAGKRRLLFMPQQRAENMCRADESILAVGHRLRRREATASAKATLACRSHCSSLAWLRPALYLGLDASGALRVRVPCRRVAGFSANHASGRPFLHPLRRTRPRASNSAWTGWLKTPSPCSACQASNSRAGRGAVIRPSLSGTDAAPLSQRLYSRCVHAVLLSSPCLCVGFGVRLRECSALPRSTSALQRYQSATRAQYRNSVLVHAAGDGAGGLNRNGGVQQTAAAARTASSRRAAQAEQLKLKHHLRGEGQPTATPWRRHPPCPANLGQTTLMRCAAAAPLAGRSCARSRSVGQAHASTPLSPLPSSPSSRPVAPPAVPFNAALYRAGLAAAP